MKKIFALIAIVALLTACGGAQQEAVQCADSTKTAQADSVAVQKDTAAIKADTAKTKEAVKPVEKKK